MKTENIISQDVKIIRVVNLKKGDLVKMLIKEYSSGYEVQYGLVTDIYMNGEKTFVEMVQYESRYSGELKVTYKVYTNGDDLNIFPASIDEVSEYFKNTVTKIEKNIEDKKEELLKMQKGLEKAKEFISGELQKEVRQAESVINTQEEYKIEKKEEEKKKLLE